MFMLIREATISLNKWWKLFYWIESCHIICIWNEVCNHILGNSLKWKELSNGSFAFKYTIFSSLNVNIKHFKEIFDIFHGTLWWKNFQSSKSTDKFQFSLRQKFIGILNYLYKLKSFLLTYELFLWHKSSWMLEAILLAKD